jgi:hypothetical protein
MKADFAATVELKSKYMGTCEQSRQTNLYVCNVLHSAGEIPTKAGQQRQVVCDVWRYFTNAKPSAMVHQRVQQDIAKHYKRLIPTLERMEIESDGSTSQFKGRFNFWVLGGGMFSEGDYAGLKTTGQLCMKPACSLVCSVRASPWHFTSIHPPLDGVKITPSSSSSSNHRPPHSSGPRWWVRRRMRQSGSCISSKDGEI